jgi:hypothetical protein
MEMNVGRELAELERMTLPQLRDKYAELFGEHARTNNRTWLVRRLAWRLQALALGDLSERARQRAAELGNDADLRLTPPRIAPTIAPPERTTSVSLQSKTDNRLPPPGTIISRQYKGQALQVQVLPQGFEFRSEFYRSLSAVAKAITGTHCNGFHFFRMTANGDDE